MLIFTRNSGDTESWRRQHGATRQGGPVVCEACGGRGEFGGQEAPVLPQTSTCLVGKLNAMADLITHALFRTSTQWLTSKSLSPMYRQDSYS